MCVPLKSSFQISLHSNLDCVCSVASFSTLEAGWSSPVSPHPATAQRIRSRLFPPFLGSSMGLTYLFSTAGRLSWGQCNRQWTHHNTTDTKGLWGEINTRLCLPSAAWRHNRSFRCIGDKGWTRPPQSSAGWPPACWCYELPGPLSSRRCRARTEVSWRSTSSTLEATFLHDELTFYSVQRWGQSPRE